MRQSSGSHVLQIYGCILKIPQQSKHSLFESVGTAKNNAEDDNRLTKVSSAAGLGNKMKLKLRLAPLSLICI